MLAASDAYLGNGHDGLPLGPGSGSEDEIGGQLLAALSQVIRFEGTALFRSPANYGVAPISGQDRQGSGEPSAGRLGVQVLPNPALEGRTAQMLSIPTSIQFPTTSTVWFMKVWWLLAEMNSSE